MKDLLTAVKEHRRNFVDLDLSRERGGLIFCENRITIEEFDNESANDQQFVARFDKKTLRAFTTIGLWHTHERPVPPSFRDVFQIMVLNIKYRKSFYLVIFTPKSAYVFLWKKFFPVVKTLKDKR